MEFGKGIFFIRYASVQILFHLFIHLYLIFIPLMIQARGDLFSLQLTNTLACRYHLTENSEYLHFNINIFHNLQRGSQLQ